MLLFSNYFQKITKKVKINVAFYVALEDNNVMRVARAIPNQNRKLRKAANHEKSN